MLIIDINFNPTLVRFKLISVYVKSDEPSHFNPTIVRFKRGVLVFGNTPLLNFNPTIVRFKLRSPQLLLHP